MRAERKGDTYVCQHCGKEFFVPQYDINCRPTIKYCSRNCYHAASKKPDIIRKCEYCGKEFVVARNHKDKKFCDLKCSCAYKRARARVATIGSKGYKYVWFSDGSCQPEHRYIMERELGRKLETDEIVHHIDGNRTNNEISNLAVMAWGEHSSVHRKQEIASGKNLFGRDYECQ